MTTSVFPAPSSGKSQQTAVITSTQSWTAPAGVTSVDVLLVGGGGAGGHGTGTRCGGGGGGGGVIDGIFAVTPGTNYTITIGAGGAWTSQSYGANGGDSTIASLGLTALGGGGGGGYEPSYWGAMSAGMPGGCGGGTGLEAAYASGNRGGGGGGAGESPSYFAVTNSTPSYAIGGPGFQGGHGKGTTTNANNGNYNSGVFASGGRAYKGRYGGGGGGCSSATVQPNNFYSGMNNVGLGGNRLVSGGDGAWGNGNTGAVTPAVAGITNSGGGGGGGGYTAYGTGNAANGGSGVCIIKYWA